MRDRRPKCKCGRRCYPSLSAAQQAAGRGSRQCDNPEVGCVPYNCIHGNYHVIFHPRGIRSQRCKCGLIMPTLPGCMILLKYLLAKHPDPANPYTLFLCEHRAAHVARLSAVPEGAELPAVRAGA